MEKFKFDVVAQTLTITAKFAEAMNNPEREEYKLVQKFRADFPALVIMRKTHKSATHYTTKSGEKFNCNQFKNLTYERMEKFLSALPKKESYLREYYRVDRMERISQPLAMPREGRELYKEKDITSQKAKVFDMYGGTACDVRIRFRNELADAVIDQFGKDIQMFAVDAEHFTITAPIEVSPTFFAWIATFGRRVKILSPEPVVAKMQEFLQKSLEMYKNDGEM